MSNIEARYLNEGTKLHNERYIIERTIGAGGFGVTYAAWDTTLQTRVAIKEYLPGEFSTRAPGTITVSIYGGEKEEQYKDGLKKFYDESRHLAQFQGIPGIVQVFDVFMENDTAYIVMEYLEGETLGERLKREEKIPYQEAVKIMLPILQALKAVHKEGILHRDIAPNNIFLCKNGDVKLLDFGAARSATGTHSKSLTVLYKEGYTAEEQYRSRGDQGAWTDVYACAATLYKMITGNIPQGAMERRRKDMLKAPSKCGIKLPANVERAIMNALNLDIKDRTQTAGLFMDELLSSKGVKNRFKKVKNKKRDRVPVWIWGMVSVALMTVGMFIYLLSIGMFDFVDGFSNLFVESGKSRVINVINMEEAEAIEKLAAIDLLLEIDDIRYSNKVEEGRIISQIEKKGDLLDEGSTVHVVVSKGAGIVSVPDMVGREWSVVQTELDELCLEYEINEKKSDEAPGYVCEQGTIAGAQLEQGNSVSVVISTGNNYSEYEEYTAENLVGLTYEESKLSLAENGIYLQVSEQRYDDVIEKGCIIQQAIAEGEVMDGGDVQTVIVSAGLEPKEVPQMVGILREDAKNLLEKQNLTVEVQYVVDQQKEEGIVLSQSVNAGTMVDKFSQIVIDVCSHGSIVPDFTGMTLTEAEELATTNNLILNVTYAWGQEDTVLSQDLDVDSVVDLNSTVAINVGLSQTDFTNRLVELINQQRQAAGMGNLSLNETWCNSAATLAATGRTSTEAQNGGYNYAWALPSYNTVFWATREWMTTPENLITRLPFNNIAFLDPGMKYLGIGYSGQRISILVAQ